jgi:hypothetical protein
MYEFIEGFAYQKPKIIFIQDSHCDCHCQLARLANFALVLRAMGPLGLISSLCYSNFLGGIF